MSIFRFEELKAIKIFELFKLVDLNSGQKWNQNLAEVTSSKNNSL